MLIHVQNVSDKDYFKISGGFTFEVMDSNPQETLCDNNTLHLLSRITRWKQHSIFYRIQHIYIPYRPLLNFICFQFRFGKKHVQSPIIAFSQQCKYQFVIFFCYHFTDKINVFTFKKHRNRKKMKIVKKYIHCEQTTSCDQSVRKLEAF